MIIKRYLGGLLALSMVLALASCGADSEPTFESKASETQTSSITETIPNVESEPQDENIIDINAIDDSSIPGITITVDTFSYIDGQLSFGYEGEEYTLPLSRDKFANDDKNFHGTKMMSEQIINNKLGETVKAEMLVNEAITEIYRCNVIDQNGMRFTAGMLENEPEDIKRHKEEAFPEEYAYTLTKIEGTKYELSNIKHTFMVDLNDLQIHEKVRYPDSEFDVKFDGYRFEDGQFIINDLRFFQGIDEEFGSKSYGNRTNLDLPYFFGTVQSYDGETADVLLTDGVTAVNVPTYYCEEELSPGKEVMMTLDCETELFGSGESRSFDYAVIYTDPKIYNYDNYDFSTLAYATASEYVTNEYDYVFIDEVK